MKQLQLWISDFINANPGFINHCLLRGTPQIVIIWYLHGTPKKEQPFGVYENAGLIFTNGLFNVTWIDKSHVDYFKFVLINHHHQMMGLWCFSSSHPQFNSPMIAMEDHISYLAAISACGRAQRWSDALLHFQQLLQRSLAVAPNVLNSASWLRKTWRRSWGFPGGIGFSWENPMKDVGKC